MLPVSKLNTEKNSIRFVCFPNEGEKLRVTVRWDDRCKNGHNTFSVTRELFENRRLVSCGIANEEDIRDIPELQGLLKYHLFSSDGPMHYIENTLFHASDRNCWGKKEMKKVELEFARSSACWPEATLEQLQSPEILLTRLPGLMEEFKEVVEALGFEY